MMSSLSEIDSSGRMSCHPLCDLNKPFHYILNELMSNTHSLERNLSFPVSTFQGTPLFLGLHFNGVEMVEVNDSHSMMAKSVILWYFSRVDTPSRRKMYKATFLMSIGFGFLLIFVIAVVIRQVSLRVTPFLGVDDAFILIHRWQYRSNIPEHTLRLRKVIVDVGPSITITSLTNIVAFGVGFFTPTPQMSLFCLSTSVALLLDYILTYTVLAPVVYLCNGDKDYQRANALPTKSNGTNLLNMYSRLLCSLSGRLLCGAFLFFLYTFSAVGIYTMKSTFEPAKAFPSDSPLVNSLKGIRPVFNTYFLVNIYVNNPPIISNKQQHTQFYNMVSDLENIRGSYGRERTLLFLTPYEKFDREVTSWTQSLLWAPGIKYQPSLHNLQYWLDRVGNPSYIKYVRDNETDEGHLTSFSFAIIGKGMAEWANRAQFVHGVRTVLAHYPQFNASLFDGDSAVLSLILTVRLPLIYLASFITLIMQIITNISNVKINKVTNINSNLSIMETEKHNSAEYGQSKTEYKSYGATRCYKQVGHDLIGSIAVTVACMAAVCLLFVSSKIGVIIITYTIISICFTLVGCLSWWGADLDPVTQVDVLLATGFSVDYTAHVAYQFYRTSGSAEERVISSLGEMAAPMIQAGLSTFLCMLPLIFVLTYAIVAFAKTIFIVVGIGLIHGLFVLPVLLAITLPTKATPQPAQLPLKDNRLIENGTHNDD
uniref:SSD domain-containing protein n=1 Tax=Heterorhabditis bacteriophora TaxID=37862 RepID=A0A1I7XQ14_HETBA